MIQFIKNSSLAAVKADNIIEKADAPINNFLPLEKNGRGEYSIVAREFIEDGKALPKRQIKYEKSTGKITAGQFFENKSNLTITNSSTPTAIQQALTNLNMGNHFPRN